MKVDRRTLVTSGFASALLAQANARAALPGVSADLTPDAWIDIAGSRPEKSWPAYTAIENARRVEIPFSPRLTVPPKAYKGDFYADEFTDAKIRPAWRALDENSSARADALRYAAIFGGPNEYRSTGILGSRKSFHGIAERDLRDVRRPIDFVAEPYREAIAALERFTTSIELEVDTDANDRRIIGADAPATMHVRGWHIRGAGVAMKAGGRRRAMIVMLGGRTTELTAFHDPRDVPFTMAEPGRLFVPGKAPTATTEKLGARSFRDNLVELHEAGFDVLAMDHRGHGVSDGVNASNAFQQGMDILRLLDAFDHGGGLRIIPPDGQMLSGRQAARRVLGVEARSMPVVLVGNSQGTMVGSYIMHANFVSRRAFDRPSGESDVPTGFAIRGAAMLAEYVKGLGHGYQVWWDGKSQRNSFLAEAALRSDYGIAFAPSSEILGGIPLWPGLFLGRGLWDSAGALAGTLDAYRRATNLREIVVVRGPHGFAEGGQWNDAYIRARVVNFAKLAVGGQGEPLTRAPQDIRDLVLSSPQHWGEFMAPST